MKIKTMLSVFAVFLFYFSMSYADDNANSSCLNSPKQINWGSGGSTLVTLCGYQNGDVNTSYVQFSNIPRETKNGCVRLNYEPSSDSDHGETDSLTVAPNEGVVLGDTRSPTTLNIDNEDGLQTIALPLKTDNVHQDDYGFSVSGQSSSVNVKVKIDWGHETGCGD